MPRHSSVAASLGGSQVIGHPPSACWLRCRWSRAPAICASVKTLRHREFGPQANCSGESP